MVKNDFSGEMRKLAFERGIIAKTAMQEVTWPSRYSLLWNLVEKNLLILAAQRSAEVNRGRLDVDASTIGKDFRHDLSELVVAAKKSAKLVAVATLSI